MNQRSVSVAVEHEGQYLELVVWYTPDFAKPDSPAGPPVYDAVEVKEIDGTNVQELERELLHELQVGGLSDVFSYLLG